jgi:hypothetical protein
VSEEAHVRAIAGNCVIHIMPMAIGTESSEVIDLRKLADVALDIARTVGRSAYDNNFTLPEVKSGATSQWGG